MQLNTIHACNIPALEADGWRLKEATVFVGQGREYQIFERSVQKDVGENLSWRWSQICDGNFSSAADGEKEEKRVAFQRNHPLDKLTLDIFKKIIDTYLTPKEFLNLLGVDKRLNQFVEDHGEPCRRHNRALKFAWRRILSLNEGFNKDCLRYRMIEMISRFDPAEAAKMDKPQYVKKRLANKENLKERWEHCILVLSELSKNALHKTWIFNYLSSLSMEDKKALENALESFPSLVYYHSKESLKFIVNENLRGKKKPNLKLFVNALTIRKMSKSCKAQESAQMANWYSLSDKKEAEKFLGVAVGLLLGIKDRNELACFMFEDIFTKGYSPSIHNNLSSNCKLLEAESKSAKSQKLVKDYWVMDPSNKERLELEKLKVQKRADDKKLRDIRESLKDQLMEDMDKEYLEALIVILGTMMNLDFDKTLHRFKEKAELCRLNADFLLSEMVKCSNDFVTAIKIVALIEDYDLKMMALDHAIYDYSLLTK